MECVLRPIEQTYTLLCPLTNPCSGVASQIDWVTCNKYGMDHRELLRITRYVVGVRVEQSWCVQPNHWRTYLGATCMPCRPGNRCRHKQRHPYTVTSAELRLPAFLHFIFQIMIYNPQLRRILTLVLFQDPQYITNVLKLTAYVAKNIVSFF